MDILKLDYTAKNYKDIEAALRKYIQANYPDWSDWNDSNLGVFFNQILAFVADTLLFYLDKQAEECYIDTVTQKSNLIELAKVVGFSPRTYLSARGSVVFTLVTVNDYQVIIPKYSIVSSGEYSFVTISDIIIPAGGINASCNIVEGSKKELIFYSDGSIWQSYSLETVEIDYNEIVVKVNDEIWGRVDCLATEEYASKSYRVIVDSDNIAYIKFGNDKLGKVPSVGSEIEVTFLQSKGYLPKKISTGVVKFVVSSIKNSQDDPVTVTVYNPDPIVNGSNLETIDDLRIKIPAQTKSCQRLVTKEDYKLFLETLSNISQVVLLDANDSDELIPLVLYIYFLDNNFTSPSNSAIADIQDKILDIKIGPAAIEIYPATTTIQDISITIYPSKSYTFDTAKNDAVQALTTKFAPIFHPETQRLNGSTTTGLTLGDTLYISDIITTCSNLTSIKAVDVIGPLQNITVSSTTLIKIGTITVTLGTS